MRSAVPLRSWVQSELDCGSWSSVALSNLVWMPCPTALPVSFLLTLYFSSEDEDSDSEDSEDDEEWDTGSTSSDSDSEEEEGKQTALASRFLKK